jgi:hypothetical protein
MSEALSGRLDQILPRITSEAFLSSEGIGNEIACYVFDYPAEHELMVRAHIQWIMKRFESHHPGLDVVNVNLFDAVIAYLRARGLLDKAIKLMESKGSAALSKALKGPLATEKVCRFIAAEHTLSEHDLVLISGVGSVWPMLRAHSLLNGLHAAIDQTPLVMFYPGRFDGRTLRLFGRADTCSESSGANPYYRAFTLVP